VPAISANSVTKLEIYYGNPSANAVGNGEYTFEFFDDFEKEDIDNTKWIENCGFSTSYEVSNSKLRLFGGNEGRKYLSTNQVLPSEYIAEIKFLRTGNQNTISLGTGNGCGSGIDYLFDYSYWKQYQSGFDNNQGVTNYLGGGYSHDVQTNTWYIGQEKVTGYTSKINYLLSEDRQILAESQQKDYSSSDNKRLTTDNWRATGTENDIDWILVRKFASTEPTTKVLSELNR